MAESISFSVQAAVSRPIDRLPSGSSGDFDDAGRQVRGALGDEGFSVPTEIALKADLKKKLDVDPQRSRRPQ